MLLQKSNVLYKCFYRNQMFYTNAFTEFVCFKRNSTNDDKLQASCSKLSALKRCSLRFLYFCDQGICAKKFKCEAKKSFERTAKELKIEASRYDHAFFSYNVDICYHYFKLPSLEKVAKFLCYMITHKK